MISAGLLDPAARGSLVKRDWERLRESRSDRTASRLLSLFENVLAERATARKRRRGFGAAGEILEQPSA